MTEFLRKENEGLNKEDKTFTKQELTNLSEVSLDVEKTANTITTSNANLCEVQKFKVN